MSNSATAHHSRYRARSLIALILIAGLLLPAIPARAIVGSTTEGAEAYPYVGGIWLRWNCCIDVDQDGEADDNFEMPNPPDYPGFSGLELGGPVVRTTGILIAPQIVLTNGAHFRNGRRVGVSFSNPIGAESADFDVGAPGVYEGYVYHFPGLDRDAESPLQRDLAVIVLDKDVKGISFATLAQPGTLDALKMTSDKASLTAVSYGPDSFDEATWDFARRVSSWHLTSLQGPFAKFQAPNQYACDGDQGAPYLDSAGNVTALLTFWPGFCDKWIITYGYRVDTQEARDFLCGITDANLRRSVDDPNNNKSGDFVPYARLTTGSKAILASFCTPSVSNSAVATADGSGQQSVDNGANQSAGETEKKDKKKHQGKKGKKGSKGGKKGKQRGR